MQQEFKLRNGEVPATITQCIEGDGKLSFYWDWRGKRVKGKFTSEAQAPWLGRHLIVPVTVKKVKGVKLYRPGVGASSEHWVTIAVAEDWKSCIIELRE